MALASERFDVADQAAAQIRDLLVGGAVDRNDLDRRPKLADVAGDLVHELRQLVDLQGRPAVVLALLALLLRPLAELVAGEKFEVLVGEPDVVALAQLRRVPVLAGLGQDGLCAVAVFRGVIRVAAGVAVGHAQPFLRHVIGMKGAFGSKSGRRANDPKEDMRLMSQERRAWGLPSTPLSRYDAGS